MEDLIKELRVARNKKGFTQSALAHRVGLPQGHISSIEQGKIDLRVSTLIQMARILEYEVMLVPSQFTSLVKAMIEGKEGIESEPIWQPDEEED
ncbi:MAG: helix-turn-helix domain-containing protein [Alphaproteobacteria bacterium]|nr:helix-turn-helix domain-containing protein [Alphaproteobacteria bacterium]